MVIDVHTSDARTIENEKVSGYDILAPSRHHHMNETEALAPSLPETGALAPSLPETGTLALSYELNRLAYYHCRKGQIRV